jgi:hypothetical protein
MGKAPEYYASKLSSVLSRIVKINRQLKVYPEYSLKAVNMGNARVIYSKLSVDQRKLIDAVASDLSTSSEFCYRDVLRYSVLYKLNQKDSWMFDNDEYYSLKKNLKKVNKLFHKNSYIDTIKLIIDDIEAGRYTPHDLAQINLDGSSILHSLYLSGEHPISALAKVSHFYNGLDFTDETENHRLFRKSLYLLKNID